ncbi:MAG: 3-dehydroquinate synthase [Caldilineales bacterium]|nr:3-dehydroquinate synthase [Caldilineales bacterium]
MTPLNIVLTGFMGTGKTAVGREVAARLGREFVDMDDLIVTQAEMSIPEIFERYGEERFRLLESAIVRQLAGQRGLVVATGGGALVDDGNREAMARSSLLICLTATPDIIINRIGGDTNRPMLNGGEARQRILDLLARREPAYAEMPYRIDTSARDVDAIAAEVISLSERGVGGILRLPVATPGGGGYDILIGSGTLRSLPTYLDERSLFGTVAIITDDIVAKHCALEMTDALAAARRSYTLITLPAGEAHKNLATIARIYDDLLAAGLDRSGLIVALGGGVIGDMAGFAAASYLRGIRFVQAPTTLLAMVDASVGGKTGVDLPQGKNLVGAFKQPELVLIDTHSLSSLPPAEFRNGLAEVVKHGVIADPDLFADLEGAGPESLESLVARALRVKIGVVERDPFEHGERAHLNLGHTFAHAFELVSNFGIPHGQAVAVGLAASAHLAAARGDCAAELPEQIKAALKHLDLPTRLSGLDAAAVYAAMATDKKRQSGRLRFVLPHEIGRVAVHGDVTEPEVMAALARVLGAG